MSNKSTRTIELEGTNFINGTYVIFSLYTHVEGAYDDKAVCGFLSKKIHYLWLFDKYNNVPLPKSKGRIKICPRCLKKLK